MQRTSWVLSGFLVFATCACGAAPAGRGRGASDAHTARTLPLEKIAFFEAGIAYFERAGTAERELPASLIVPETQLDDALRTLVVLSERSPGVPAFEFATSEAREATLARAALTSEEPPLSHRSLLESLVPSEVELFTKSGTISGRLVAVNDAPPIAHADALPSEPKYVAGTEDDCFLVLADRETGVRRLRASEVVRVRARDPERRRLLEQALDDPELRATAEKRALSLRVPRGPLRVGYVAEVPVWRASYRLLLSPGAAAGRLWGSALVHNDSPEPWRGVAMTFASHRPDSFVTQFASPAYTHREPFQDLPGLSPLPQLATTKPVNAATAPGSSKGRSSARTQRSDDGRRHASSGSFEYPASAPADVAPRHAASIPFLETDVEARPFVWFGPKGAARRAVWLRNTTPQTLPEGTLSLLTAAGFAGEAVMPRLLPGATRAVEFGDELDVELFLESNTQTATTISLSFDGTDIEEQRLDRYERKYRVTNRKGEPVSVAFALRLPLSITTQGFDRIAGEESAQGVLDVGANQMVTRAVVMEHRVVSRTSVEGLTAARLREFDSSAPGARAALRAALSVTERIDANTEASAKAEERAGELDSEIQEAHTDVSEAAKAGSGVVRELLGRLAELERERTRQRARSVALVRENARLTEQLTRELGRLPKTARAE
jgi:hypothetical protein